MPTQTTTHFVAKAVPSQGQRLVHGRLVGPTDETYPPGTGGPIPNPRNIHHVITKITTVKDLGSGHTQTKREVYAGSDDPEHEKAAQRAKQAPGSSIMLGRPVLSDTSQVPAHEDTESSHVSAEDQRQMDRHYYRLTKDEQLGFREAYPNYVPTEGFVDEEASAASQETQQAPAPVDLATKPVDPPKGAVKGVTTSKNIS